MQVPLLDLQAQFRQLQPQLEAALIRVAQSQAYILGPEVSAFERQAAEYLGVENAVGVSSGTDALLLALMALDVGVGDEVIVPDFSFFATAGCVARTGATPVFVDVDPRGFMMQPEAVECAITSRTAAIIPVHLFGQAAGLEQIMAIAAQHDIPVIEDAAQAIGTRACGGTRVGGIGTMGCFSFYPTKNLGAMGDAGMITTNQGQLADKLRQLRNHGMEPRYYHKYVGGNFRLDALQAAVLSIKMEHLQSWHEARQQNAELYNTLFIEEGMATAAGVTNFDESNTILLPATLQPENGANAHIYNQYTIRTKHRDAMRAYLTEHHIGTEIYYPLPLHSQECFRHLARTDDAFPVTCNLARTVLSLPVYPELTRQQIEYVVTTISNFIRSTAPQH